MKSKINLNKVSKYQKYLIKKSLIDYEFIMKNWQTQSKEFEKVYWNFYLKARRGLKKSAKEGYFNLLYQKPKEFGVALKSFRKISGRWDLSIISKMMHTIFPNKYPIIDTNVKDFLRKYYKIYIPNHYSSYNDAVKNYKKVLEWYKSKTYKSVRTKILNLFNKEFKEYKWISDIKKIDTFIFTYQNLI